MGAPDATASGDRAVPLLTGCKHASAEGNGNFFPLHQDREVVLVGNVCPGTVPAHNSRSTTFTLPGHPKMKTTKGNVFHAFPNPVTRYGETEGGTEKRDCEKLGSLQRGPPSPPVNIQQML